MSRENKRVVLGDLTRSLLGLVERGLCYAAGMRMRLLSTAARRLQRGTGDGEREEGRMLRPHYIQRTSVLAASSRVTPASKVNQTGTIRLIKHASPWRALFLRGRKFASRGHRLTSWRLIKENGWPLCEPPPVCIWKEATSDPGFILGRKKNNKKTPVMQFAVSLCLCESLRLI